MVSAEQLQQILNDPLQYAVEYRYILMCAALFLAAVLAITFGTAKTRKPQKRKPVLAPYFSEPPIAEPAANPVAAQPPAPPAVAPQLEPGPRVPVLPLPQPQDMDYARKTLNLDTVSPHEGWQLYFDGIRQNDLHMAMTGLRFHTQFIVDGGYRRYTSPWSEYKGLAESYLTLARTHNSRECLELARDAFNACDVAIYPEPSTERVSREVLQNLQLINHELAVRPGT